MPDGTVLIVNGAQTGTAGYGNVPDQIGQLNADNPASPLADDSIMIAGSNPNLNFETRKYPTEYRVEILSPPSVLNKLRPVITAAEETLHYGRTMRVMVKLPPEIRAGGLSDISVSVMDFGFSTHGVQMDQRIEILNSKALSRGLVGGLMLIVEARPNAHVYPPGPGFLCVSVDGKHSVMKKIMIGDGLSPPVDEGTIAK
ncbi:hypothetical protein FRC09_020848 [Ceratobasidium sp. 395]|nr:hypothetical protein FRC09_020848 [Ceratobasidium sp. 395]